VKIPQWWSKWWMSTKIYHETKQQLQEERFRNSDALRALHEAEQKLKRQVEAARLVQLYVSAKRHPPLGKSRSLFFELRISDEVIYSMSGSEASVVIREALIDSATYEARRAITSLDLGIVHSVMREEGIGIPFPVERLDAKVHDEPDEVRKQLNPARLEILKRNEP